VPPEGETDREAFFVREVVPRLRSALEKGGATQPAQFLVGLRGHLFSIGTEFSAAELEEPWTAIGSGRFAAYGALYALEHVALPAEPKVRLALEASERYTNNVRKPFVLLGNSSRGS
jgi:hypothetical protein